MWLVLCSVWPRGQPLQPHGLGPDSNSAACCVNLGQFLDLWMTS